MQGRDDGAVGKGKLAVVEGLERHVVSKDSADAVQVAFFVGDGDVFPFSIAGRNFDPENWDSFSGTLS